MNYETLHAFSLKILRTPEIVEPILQYLIYFCIIAPEVTEMKGNNTSRFTLDMTPELRTRLKIAAARKGITMRRYALSAIEQQLAREDPGVLASGNFDLTTVDKAKALQASVFREKRLPDESVEIIRQAREERTSQQ